MTTIVLRTEAQAYRLWQCLKRWAEAAQEGKPLAVTVAEAKAKRNQEQNKRYWAMLHEIAEQAWIDGRQFSSEAWHAHFAGELIGWVDLPHGRTIPISTTTLSVGEFADYMTRVEQLAVAELGCEIDAR